MSSFFLRLYSCGRYTRKKNKLFQRCTYEKWVHTNKLRHVLFYILQKRLYRHKYTTHRYKINTSHATCDVQHLRPLVFLHSDNRVIFIIWKKNIKMCRRVTVEQKQNKFVLNRNQIISNYYFTNRNCDNNLDRLIT